MKNSLLLSLIIVFVCTSLANAQQLIAPDRPGIGNGTFTVAPGNVYLESGIAYSGAGGARQISLGQVGFRSGLTEKLEIQFLLNSYSILTEPTSQSGIEDFTLGLKGDLINDPNSPLRLSGLATLSVPTGSENFSSNRTIPTLSLIGDYGLPKNWTFSSNLAYTLPVDNLDGQWLLTLTPSVVPFDDSNTNVYFGYAGRYQNSNAQHFFEFGSAFFPQAIVQLDLNAGIRLDSEGFFIGAGFSRQIK